MHIVGIDLYRRSGISEETLTIELAVFDKALFILVGTLFWCFAFGTNTRCDGFIADFCKYGACVALRAR